MSQTQNAIILLILILVLLIFLAFVGSNFLMRRAIRNVIKMFRNGQAISAETAKYQDELGFKRKAFLQIGTFRDYKPYALEFLLRNNIVQTTEDGRIYLSEEALSASNIEKRAK